MGPRHPNIGDVARRAFVSKTTVSHVLNGTRFVSEGTRQRVLQAVAELGYRPSAVARSLKTAHTGTIGLVLPDVSPQFFTDLLYGLEDVLRPAGYGLLVCHTDETSEDAAHYLELLLRQRVEGIIAAPTSGNRDLLEQAVAWRTPVVLVDRTCAGLESPFVGVDNRSGARRGTRHLIENGHRRLGVIAGPQQVSTLVERLLGFRQALEEEGIPLPEEWIATCPANIEGARQAARQILSLPQRPTALFLNNNVLSLGALSAVRELGLRCPADIALVGFDDHPWAAVSDPPLTVVRQPVRRIGQVAAEMLCSLIRGQGLAQPRVILDCDLVLRQSCCRAH